MPFISATILTGFLGSGKTTLLKHILAQPQGGGIAVIENEFGEENIDAEIVFANARENIVQLSNGCICCKIREDLRDALRELAHLRQAGKLKFERVVIETTGLADPAPVAQTFFVDERISEAYALDAVVTMVDAGNAGVQLDRWQEARRQVGFADRLFITKSDRVLTEDLKSLQHRLALMNPRAPQHQVRFGEVALAEVFDIGGFHLTSRLEINPLFLHHQTTHEHADGHHDHAAHADDVMSFVFRSDRAFDPLRLERFMGDLADEHGASMLRYKGILHVAGTSRKVILQGVHQLMNSDQGPRWAPDEVRQTRMVFIGIGMPESFIRAGLVSCLN